MNQILLAILLSMAPISELRGGIPVAIAYGINNNLTLAHILLLICLMILVNILVVFLIFAFLDFFHTGFLRFKFYNKFFVRFLDVIRKKIDKVEENYAAYGFLGLMLFVAIPVPGTGAWTGVLIAWILGLERKRSILAISSGVVLAGIIVSLATFAGYGLFKIFS
jgi:uncharacterized membrane protein